jgi:hypothetical protein
MNGSVSVSLGAHIISRDLLIGGLTLRYDTSVRSSNFSPQ